MSATLEAQKLAHYFPIKIYNENRDCPVIDVGEKMNYDVKIFYLDDLKPCQTLFLQNVSVARVKYILNIHTVSTVENKYRYTENVCIWLIQKRKETYIRNSHDELKK